MHRSHTQWKTVAVLLSVAAGQVRQLRISIDSILSSSSSASPVSQFTESTTTTAAASGHVMLV